MASHSTDILIAGAGVGGICAALAAARTGSNVLLVEKANEIGGTGIHSPVSLICKFHGTDHRPINIGIHRELFPNAYLSSTRDHRPSAKRLTYDEEELLIRYKELLSREPLIELRTSCGVKSVELGDELIESALLDDGTVVKAATYIDATANGVLAWLAGCQYEKGRTSDGAMQSATLVFGVSHINKGKLKKPDFTTREGLDGSLWRELTPLFKSAKIAGKTENPRDTVLCFPYPDGERLLFNSTAVLGVDPTIEGSEAAAIEKGTQQIHELHEIIKQHPAFAESRIDFIATKLGVREGRRIKGHYQLTKEDCLGEARFDDMVAACAYELDIHNPEGGNAFMKDIPGSGYYHIPYRCLISADRKNLLLGSRCISGTHEAHSSYRVMSGVSAIGQAAGTAAALASQHAGGNAAEVPSSWIRYILRQQVQFVEGEIEPPPQTTAS